MYFKKGEGRKTNSITDILEQYLQDKFKLSLKRHGYVVNTVENNTAYIEINGLKYPNITYGYSASDIKSLVEGFNFFIDSFIDTLTDQDTISFRQPVEIERRNEGYELCLRLAIINIHRGI